MGHDDTEAIQYHGPKRKTPNQLQFLEKIYSDDKHPKPEEMEEYAVLLKLTYQQIRRWFTDRRRRDRREKQIAFMPSVGVKKKELSRKVKNKKSSRQGGRDSHSFFHSHLRISESSIFNKKSSQRESDNSRVYSRGRPRFLEELADNLAAKGKNHKAKKSFFTLPVLYTKDYILRRVFRKDGPTLGVEFDRLPENAFQNNAASYDLLLSCKDYPSTPWFSEVLEQSLLDARRYCVRESCPSKKYGIGKGLMALCPGGQPSSGKLLSSLDFTSRKSSCKLLRSDALGKILHQSSRNLRSRKLIALMTRSQKLPENRKLTAGKKKVPFGKIAVGEKLSFSTCRLVSSERNPSENMDEQMFLIDDEELELRELQGGPNPLKCSAHLTSSGLHNCPLCKDLLSKFPPPAVKMRRPFHSKPWDSSPLLVKKLFKVSQFLYKHAATIELCSFTIDEFCRAFLEKNALLLGKIHVALLKLLLLDVEDEIMSGFLPRVSKDCRFLVLLQFVKNQELDVKFLSQSLNPLTWPEILRQVMIAAGFGLRHNALRRETFNKERNQMTKYGLRPLTLKGELFCILSGKGNRGSSISDLAKVSQIIALDEYNTSDELQEAICTTLSSDVTLFEKIGPSTYRLRVDPQIKGKGDDCSDFDDLGSVDDDMASSSASSSSDESEGSRRDSLIVPYKERNRKKWLKLYVDDSIDESYSGKAWVLGLMEGEYYDLKIDEKLDALIALVDLVASGSSCQMKPLAIQPSTTASTNRLGGRTPSTISCANKSGGKIKKLFTSEPLPEYTSLDSSRICSSRASKFSKRKSASLSSYCLIGCGEVQKCSTVMGTDEENVHPMHSIYLGSDRRYNSYWLFLGPCNANDPGHRTVYFESSEDGHWEVINTSQDLRFLLSVLDCRGRREAHLFSSFTEREVFLCKSMDDYISVEKCSNHAQGSEISELDSNTRDTPSPISDVDNISSPSESLNPCVSLSADTAQEMGNKFEEKKEKCEDLQAFDKWVWSGFYSNLNAVKYSNMSFMESLVHCDSCHDLYWQDEKHCGICHITLELDFDLEERYAVHVATCREIDGGTEFPRHKVLPSPLQALKAGIHAIEASVPDAALVVSWRRLGRKLWVKRLRRTSSLPELLQVLNDFVASVNLQWLCESSGSNATLEEAIVHFQTIPQTIPAVALWIVKLDTLIGPYLRSPQCTRALGVRQEKRRRVCIR